MVGRTPAHAERARRPSRGARRRRCRADARTSSAPGWARVLLGVEAARGSPTPTTAARDARAHASRTLLLDRVDGDDGDAGRVGQRDHLGAIEDDRAAGLDARARGRRTSAMVRIVSGPTAGRSKRRSCVGLLTFTTTMSPFTSCAGAADRRVGALDPLDRQHRPAAHDDALADVELPDHLGGAEAEADVAPTPRRVGARRAEHAGRGHDLVEEERRLDDRDALALELGGDAAQQDGRRAACRAREDRGSARASGRSSRKSRGLAMPPTMTARVTPRALSASMMPAELAGLHPGDARARRCSSSGSVSPRCATAHDLDAVAPRRLGEEHREAAVAGDEADPLDAHHRHTPRVGRWRRSAAGAPPRARRRGAARLRRRAVVAADVPPWKSSR